MSIPSTSAISEALEEVLELCQAPRITRPWRASTAAGRALDMAVPLYRTGLSHGSILVLTPAEPVDAPIMRDSAEALVAQTTGRGAEGALSGATLLGCLLLCVLLAGVVGWPAAWTAGAVTALALLAWHRRRVVLAPVAVGLAACAAAAAVTAEGFPLQSGGWGWVVLAACGAALLMLAVTAILGAISTRMLAGLGTTILLLACSCLGFLVPEPFTADRDPAVAAVAGVSLVAGLVVFAAAPAAVTGLAGLDIPRLPTAGQDLSVADGVQSDVEARARRARHLADGVAVAAAVVMATAVVAVGATGGLGPQLLALGVAGATGMHAARHRSPVPAWSLSVVALAGLTGVVLAAAVAPEPESAAGITSLSLAVLSVLVSLGAVVWAERVHTVDPSTAAWWERLEMIALIACFPLAAWVGGLFDLVRGLG